MKFAMKHVRSMVAAGSLLSFGLLTSTGAWARDPMAQLGEAYVGPKTLSVYLAPTAKGDQALIKVFGVNHAWNNKILLAKLSGSDASRVEYVIQAQGGDYVVMRDDGDRGVSLYLPGLAAARLAFDRSSALEIQPEHLMTEYLDQGKFKP